jgi:hypothetical protein
LVYVVDIQDFVREQRICCDVEIQCFVEANKQELGEICVALIVGGISQETEWVFDRSVTGTATCAWAVATRF